jgi:hypothetical protein
MNGALLKGQKHLTWPNGMKLSILTTVLSSDETLLTSLNAVYSASSSPHNLKMSLTPFMKDLKRDLLEEGIEELRKKEKGLEGFSNIIEHLHHTAVPPSWPLSGFDSIVYNSDFPFPYENFLNLNSHSSYRYFPYHTCYDVVVCVQEGLIINTYIDNPHYFVEMHFDLPELLAILPVLVTETPQTHPTTYQSRKEIRSDIWRSRNGIGKRRNRILPVAMGLIGNMGTRRVTTTPSFSLLHYLAEMFIDDYFSDLL